MMVYFQTSIEVYECLKNGVFGLCEKQAMSYKSQCNKMFPYATVFKSSNPSAPVTNHVDLAAASDLANGETDEHIS
jgi:hypothetical protein